jgi:hypothetical protein
MQAFPPAAPERTYQQRFAPLGLLEPNGSPYAQPAADLARDLAGLAAGREQLEQIARNPNQPKVTGWPPSGPAVSIGAGSSASPAPTDPLRDRGRGGWWPMPDRPTLPEPTGDQGAARFRADLATYLSGVFLHELGELLGGLPEATRVALMVELSLARPGLLHLHLLDEEDFVACRVDGFRRLDEAIVVDVADGDARGGAIGALGVDVFDADDDRRFACGRGISRHLDPGILPDLPFGDAFHGLDVGGTPDPLLVPRHGTRVVNDRQHGYHTREIRFGHQLASCLCPC